MGVLDEVREQATEAENAQPSESETSAESEPTTPAFSDVPTPKAKGDPFAHTWETDRFEADSDTLHDMSGMIIALGNLI